MCSPEAGWYENLTVAQDPRWSYAMRWDPDHRADGAHRRIRIHSDSVIHQRFWFVLYQGTYGPNAPLKAWLDTSLYPAGGEWQEDTLYLAYAYPSRVSQQAAREDRFENSISLREARWSAQVPPGGACTLELAWETGRPLDKVYKVFVHAVDDSGTLLGQHDAVLGTDERPSNTWASARRCVEHGLFIGPTVRGGAKVHLWWASTMERVGSGSSWRMATIRSSWRR